MMGWMVFFMQSLLSSKGVVLLGVLLCLSCSVGDEQKNIQFLKKAIRASEQGVVLDADVGVQLGAEAEKALKNGVPLVWVVTARLWQSREIIWDKKIAEVVYRYQISYHALMDIYRVKDEQSGAENTFTSLQLALNEIGSLKNILITADRSISKNNLYSIGLLFALDKERLPVPLRLVAYYDPEWALTSQWNIWSF
jgi:hypothetical protein